MKKNIIIIAGTAIAVLLAGFLLLGYSEQTFTNIYSYFQSVSWRTGPYEKSNILFYGEGCDHCVTVDDFIKKNNIEDSIAFIRLEVFSNIHNENILSDRAKICGLDIQQIGVPFFWEAETQKCVLGDADIISHFKGKINPKKP
jgi:hypothetical protein